MEADKLRIARDKLTRVFRYLEALNQHRNPPRRQIREQPWSLRLDGLPSHSAINKGAGRPKPTKAKSAEPATAEPAEGFVLKVQRPTLTRPPEPPEIIANCLEAGWDDPCEPVVVHQALNELEPTGGSRALNVDDHKARSAALQHWTLLRDEWAKNEQPARATMKVFENLYTLYGSIDRESERVELVLGDGILSWKRSEGNIYHPILLQRVQLQFDASVPEFTISEADHPVELYSALFQSMTDVDGRAIGRCREELDQEGFHPLVNGSTSGFLRRLVIQLSPRGEFLEDHAPAQEQTDPCIGRDPILFLRARTLGFAAAIERILSDLRSREDLPWSLLNIVGEESPNVVPAEREGTPNDLAESDAQVLLSKPANPEQIRIAKQLEQHGGVLVQGPPGTGKTHTIGNLVGHLLAHGKSVLVTSHTTKALRMVRNHIVSELRPLCVSVLESDLDSRKQLESAVGSIAERLSRVDAHSLEVQGQHFASTRRDLLNQLDEIRKQLAAARADEYRDIVIAGNSWAPSDAARKVAKEKDTLGWIPGPVAAVAPLPLAPGELSDLYRSSVSISREDENELSGHLPELHDLPRPDDFANSLNERNGLNMDELELRADLWQSVDLQGTPEEFETLAANLTQAIEPLTGDEKWKLAAIYAGKYSHTHREPWDHLVDFIRLVHREAANFQESFVRHGPQFLDDADFASYERIAAEICAHLQDGGKLGSFVLFTHKSWGQFIEMARVTNAPPRTPEHFQSLRKLAHLQRLRQELRGRWDRQVAVLGAPPSVQMGEEVEKTLMQFCDSLDACLCWHPQTWLPLQQQLAELGFRWDTFLAEQPVVVGVDGELVRIGRAVSLGLLAILDSRRKKLRLLQLETEFHELWSNLKLAVRLAKSSKVTAKLLAAVASKNSGDYRDAHDRLLELKSRQADLDLRRVLLSKLEGAAPAWAGAIRNRTGVHGRGEPPRDPAGAWTWRQLNDELDRRASVSLESLQTIKEKLTEQLRRATVGLIENNAWSAQARRTSSRQRQALVGWLDTIRRIGKGHGMRVSLLRSEAARKMSECRGAVPVWVMPLSRVVENFDPCSTRFDVVIIDEASQSDVLALVALYLGKTVLVVGDHEQVSPSAVGQDLGIIQNLIFQFLRGIPNADLYDGQISIYDLARQSFGGTTCLVEHFRCVPEIIQFSNMISYDNRIKPLRDESRVPLRPHTVACRVTGSSRDGKLNRLEALAVASLLASALEQPEYQENDAGQPSSFGVVSLVGDEQALEIDNLLRKHISPDRYETHRLLCGNAAQFQGDERDVIFISLVDTAPRGQLSLRDQELFKQRFNVAASRARDQMWVVHSLSPQHDLKSDDLRRQLIEHANDPTRLMQALEEKEKRTQSPLEGEVMKHLMAAGYAVTPHWHVGAFRIDLVVEGDGRRLAIECDGDRFYPLEKLQQDMDRQAVLERMGWIFVRIRGTEFFRNPGRAMQPVFDKLRLLEISPRGPEISPVAVVSVDLISRVIGRAEELRRLWAGPEQSPSKRLASSHVAGQITVS